MGGCLNLLKNININLGGGRIPEKECNYGIETRGAVAVYRGRSTVIRMQSPIRYHTSSFFHTQTINWSMIFNPA